MKKRMLILTLLIAGITILTSAAMVHAKSELWLEDQEAEWGDFETPTVFAEPRYFMTLYGLLDSDEDVDV
ncbi:MAG TPA: hypothetical protein VJZ27_05675, partial [Aggregatilineales bacterium]|nr:hypothetical protein [Aggregatilineales bacterium]